MYKLMCSFLFTSLLACTGNVELSDFSLKIHENEEKWDSLGPTNYSYTYSRFPVDCPQADAMPPVVITVESGVVVSVYSPELNTYLSNIESWPTIDLLFEEMISLYMAEHKFFSKSEADLGSEPEFDLVYGYPISYYVDKSDSECDAFSVITSEFQ